jgi:hypothetical protein
MQDFAERAHANGEFFFYVRIPGNVEPLERGARFEDPLEAALQESGLGSVEGGGSQTSKQWRSRVPATCLVGPSRAMLGLS